MVMLLLVIDAETNNDLVQEPVLTIFLSPCIEIITGVENQLIFTGNKTITFQQRMFTTAIGIGDRAGYGDGLSAAKQLDTDRRTGAAIGDIQYVCS